MLERVRLIFGSNAQLFHVCVVFDHSGAKVFVEIGDDFTTGSSMMPQKKNPDIAELVRGKTGRVYGDLVSLLTVMKALPLSYNRDMQEDKEPLFDAAETVSACLSVFSKMIKTVKFNDSVFYSGKGSDLSLATDVADYLVGKKAPFRIAHAISGSLVSYCISKNKGLAELALKDFRKFSRLFQKDIFKILDIQNSITGKVSEGSTSPKEVRKAIGRWKRKLEKG